MNNRIKANWDKITNKKGRDFFQLALAKATLSKQNDKFALFVELLKFQFTAITNGNKLANGSTPFHFLDGSNSGFRQFVDDREVFLNFAVEEIEVAKEILKKFNKSFIFNNAINSWTVSELMEDKTYLYFFTRQDISQEQQVIQTAHAAACAARVRNFDPWTQHFVAFGVADREALLERVNWVTSKGIDHVMFYEPDNDMAQSSFSVGPIKKSVADKKKLFTGESLLSYPKVTACICD